MSPQLGASISIHRLCHVVLFSSSAHLLFTSVQWARSTRAPLQCFLKLFLLISTITILVQATIILWNSLIQSPCFSVLVLSLISFILAPEYLSYLCHCITETILSPFLFPGLEDKIGPHFQYRVNISGMSTDEATSRCSSGLQVVTWEYVLSGPAIIYRGQ